MANGNEPNWTGMETGKWSVNSDYDPKQCCDWQTLENYPLQLFGGNANPVDAAADAMDSPALLYVNVAPCQTENCDNPNNTQEVDMEEEDDT